MSKIVRKTVDGKWTTADEETGAEGGGGGSTPGAAVWYGPYHVDFNDFKEDGDEVEFFETTAGDALVGAFYDPKTAVNWTSDFGPDIAFDEDPPGPAFEVDAAWLVDPTKIIGDSGANARDLSAGTSKSADGADTAIGQRVFVGGSFKGKLTQGPGENTAGEMDLYFAIATPVAP